jgi:hypothetical protein
MPTTALAVRIDGELLSEEEGRALWQRFSAYMEANRGDLAGFAKSEGLASVHPAMEVGRAILVGSRSATAEQRPYASVAKGVEPPPQGAGSGSGGGSTTSQAGAPSARPGRRKRR